MRPIIKICGLMNTEDAEMCLKYGADILGFVVEYPRPVPWNLSIKEAKEMMHINAPTCIVTGGDPKKILDITHELRPDYIQLHYNESMEDVAFLATALPEVKIIKTIFPNNPNIVEETIGFCNTGIYALLLDPRIPDSATHGGQADLDLFMHVRSALDKPLILAGGVNPENIREIVQQVRPEIIDLMTGVECYPGKKDESRVRRLFRNARFAALDFL